MLHTNVEGVVFRTINRQILCSHSPYDARWVNRQALFRALKTKGNTPKYGIIYHSTFIGRAAAKNKGRISRVLANKCSIASRIDRWTFSYVITSIGMGPKVLSQILILKMVARRVMSRNDRLSVALSCHSTASAMNHQPSTAMSFGSRWTVVFFVWAQFCYLHDVLLLSIWPWKIVNFSQIDIALSWTASPFSWLYKIPCLGRWRKD